MPSPTSGAYYDFRSDTPESTRARRKLLDTMLEQAATYKPLGHWSAALAQGFQGLMGGMGINDLRQEEKADRTAAAEPIRALGTPGLDDTSPIVPPVAPPAMVPPELTPPAPPTPPAPRAPIQPAPRVQAPDTTPAMPASAASPNPVGYDFRGPPVNGDRAHGRYGVMGAQVPSYTKEVLGAEMTPDAFLANPQAQDAVAKAMGMEPVPQALAPGGASPMPPSAPAATPIPAAPIPAAGGLPTGPATGPLAPPVPAPPGARPIAAAVGAEGASRAPAPPSLAPYLSKAINENAYSKLQWAIANSNTAPPHAVAEAWSGLKARAEELRKSDTPMTREEVTTHAKTQAEANTAINEAELKRREVLKSRTGPETAQAVSGILQEARQLPVDFGKGAFERGTGPYVGSAEHIYENPLGMISGQIGRGLGEIKSAIEGGARPAEVQDRVRTVQSNLVAILGPSVRAPGAQSNYELQQIEAQAGALARSTGTEDYNRRLDALEKNVGTFLTRFADPVKLMHTVAGPRSPNAPDTVEGGQSGLASPAAVAGYTAALKNMLSRSAPAQPTMRGMDAMLPIQEQGKRDKLKRAMMGQ
jgi:hypothetical protein